MKFLVLSDLHVEFAAYKPAANVDYDALILAGDIQPAGGSLPDWAAWTFGRDKPIVIVAGNHEFYGAVMDDERLRMRAHQNANVHVLDPGEVRLQGGRVRVLGCTLWTDFALPIQVSPKGAAPVLRTDPEHAMRESKLTLNDYSRIAVMRDIRSAPGGGPSTSGNSDEDGLLLPSAHRRLTPEDTLRLHLDQRTWLMARLREPFAGTTVVATHHAPSRQSIAEHWARDCVSAAFASELPDAFFEVPALWVHGHTHTSFDYVHGRTRVVCNPRGYVRWNGTIENAKFDPRLVITLGAPGA